MYTGTLINDLMNTVARAEHNVQSQTHAEEEKLQYWYAVAQGEMAQFESSLAGVA
jgi:uncharacterized protein YccT (UPF0319 family)